MVIVRFPDDKAERSALGCLPGRFAFKTWAGGEMMLPENALRYLALEGVAFQVEGPATHERLALCGLKTRDMAD